MAIQSLLNPIDEDSHWVLVRSPSSDTESDSTTLTPASSPGTTCSFQTDATTWNAQSDDGMIISSASHTATTNAENGRVRSVSPAKLTVSEAATQDRPTTFILGPDEVCSQNRGHNPYFGTSVSLPLRQSGTNERPQSTRGGQGSRQTSRTGMTNPKGYRRPYTEEQVMWLWFFFIDIRMPWDEVIKKYNVDWSTGVERKKTGTQCRFYRLAKQYGLPGRRQMKGSPEEKAHRWGMWPIVRRSYQWMEPFEDLLQGKSMPNMT